MQQILQQRQVQDLYWNQEKHKTAYGATTYNTWKLNGCPVQENTGRTG